MELQSFKRELESRFQEKILESGFFGKTAYPQFWIETDSLLEVAKFLHQNGFSFLENCVVVQNDQTLIFGYFFRSYQHEMKVILRVPVQLDSPDAEVKVQSLQPIFEMSAPQEREISELYGVFFVGAHPKDEELRTEAWKSYPMRKGALLQ